MLIDDLTGAPAIHFRAGRTRFAIGTFLVIPITFGFLLSLIFRLTSDKPWTPAETIQVPISLLLEGVLIWLCYGLVVKLLWPPDLKISIEQFQYTLSGKSHVYPWGALVGPVETSGAYGVPLLQMTVESSGRKFLIPPSHFNSTYAEMAGIIADAQRGCLTTPEAWRAQHPRTGIPEWAIRLLIALGGAAIAVVLGARK